MKDAYRQYWMLTTLLLCAAVFAAYEGFFAWGYQKFPELTVQLVFLAIMALFCWAYVVIGHTAARDVSHNERMLDLLKRNIVLAVDTGTDLEVSLKEAYEMRHMMATTGQRDGLGLMLERVQKKFEDRLMQGVSRIDTVRIFLFFFGLFCTLIGIVQGFASQQIPTNPEEAKLYSFAIIKALGLAYVPATACIGSTLILYVLSVSLQQRIGEIVEGFEDLAFRVVVLGEKVRIHAPQSTERKDNAAIS
ncbi:MAG TPA: hypothetical protein VMU25_00690 [Candidatus Paceibacterota bacterium]|nr:hypothetical protein [Candidatus Paceibacterota bacterium]